MAFLSDWSPITLTHCCLINLIDVTLAYEDALSGENPLISIVRPPLGTDEGTKTDEFSDKSERGEGCYFQSKKSILQILGLYTWL